MKRTLHRWIPALLGLALVAWAASAPSLRARAAAAPASATVAACNIEALAGTDSVLRLTLNKGVLQPFDGSVPIASCSLAVLSGYSTCRMSIVAWDPLSLAPDPTTVALRTQSFDPSQLSYNHARMDFATPIVVAPVDGVAEPTSTTLAVDYQDTYTFNWQDLSYWSQGSPGLPPGYQYSGTTATKAPLGGPFATLGLSLCPAEGRTDLRVLQAVSGTSTMLGFEAYEYLQRFRVPEACTVQWIETAFGNNANAYPFVTGTMAILDGAGTADPPVQLPPAMFQADFYQPGITVSTWGTHYLDAPAVTLLPDHDYWLLVRAQNKYPMWVKDLDGNETPDFTGRIGALYLRPDPGVAWTALGGRALSFRLIGTPGISAVSVGPPSSSGLRLAIEPNPARGSAMVRWRGAHGAVRLEVLDPRGRRVATHEAAGAQGTWLWRGGRDGGANAAPGVYFVRVLDGSGALGTTRLVLIR